MTARSELRKSAYHYVLQILGSLSGSPDNSDWSSCIPLEELRLLKEGLEDPSPTLVNLLKDMVRGVVSESAIEDHLVVPFTDGPSIIKTFIRGETAMPRRKDIKKVMIIGSGPIIIGQACEFDYSGTQAARP
jgi:hypothetical protein